MIVKPDPARTGWTDDAPQRQPLTEEPAPRAWLPVSLGLVAWALLAWWLLR